jgi:hypothetical protein
MHAMYCHSPRSLVLSRIRLYKTVLQDLCGGGIFPFFLDRFIVIHSISKLLFKKNTYHYSTCTIKNLILKLFWNSFT